MLKGVWEIVFTFFATLIPEYDIEIYIEQNPLPVL